jgi:hypothetical protein
MRFIGGIIAGVIAGLIGAGVWGWIAYSTGYQVGYVAWGVGLLVGFAVALGCRGDTGTETGALAAVIALGAVIGGKYVAVHMIVSERSSVTINHIKATDEQAQVVLAKRLVQEYEGNGKSLKWPADMSAADATQGNDFPPELWKDTVGRWARMPATDQDWYRTQVEEDLKGKAQAKAQSITQAGFKRTFSPMDAIFFLLAVATAFRVGSGWEGGDD